MAPSLLREDQMSHPPVFPPCRWSLDLQVDFSYMLLGNLSRWLIVLLIVEALVIQVRTRVLGFGGACEVKGRHRDARTMAVVDGLQHTTQCVHQHKVYGVCTSWTSGQT
jgi:hypothetical protein